MIDQLAAIVAQAAPDFIPSSNPFAALGVVAAVVLVVFGFLKFIVEYIRIVTADRADSQKKFQDQLDRLSSDQKEMNREFLGGVREFQSQIRLITENQTRVMSEFTSRIVELSASMKTLQDSYRAIQEAMVAIRAEIQTELRERERRTLDVPPKS